MSPKAIQFRLGIGTCLGALFLGLVAIPTWVSSPSNVGNIVLAPTFWPYVLTAVAGLAGVALVVSGLQSAATKPAEDLAAATNTSWLRLVGLAVIMGLTMVALPRVGMVWTTMVVFAATAFLFRTRHPRTALICAVSVPLGLYLFFAHVAGVAIPQGDYVRLP
ncbi:MAG: tripartite tricarboxylate transporter TctB family protein [Sulfitobacter sp.]